jgi:hypothetical protein
VRLSQLSLVKFYRKILALSAAKKQFVIANVVWRSVGNEIASTTPHFETSLLVAGSHLGFAGKKYVRNDNNSVK